MPLRYLGQICEIAARLNQEARLLRSLGANDAADFVVAAMSCLDDRVYSDGHQATVVYGDEIARKSRRLRRPKTREASTH